MIALKRLENFPVPVLGHMSAKNIVLSGIVYARNRLAKVDEKLAALASFHVFIYQAFEFY